MSTQQLETSMANARAALAGVRAEQLDDPTPCASWTVRDLVNHIVGSTYWFATSVNEGGSSDDGDDVPDFTAGDTLAAFDEGAQQAVAAFGADGALDQTLDLPFGAFPAEAFLGLATLDQYQHAWDLRRATGQDADVDAAHAEAILEFAKAAGVDAFRGPDGQAPFGSEVEVDGSAPAPDRLAGYLGRSV